MSKPIYNRDLSISDYDFFKNRYKKLDRKTFSNFIDNYKEDINTKYISIQDIEIVLFESASIPNFKELIIEYPNWIFAIIELSNIGFNDSKNQALVYYGFNSGPGVGGGAYLIYEKSHGKWKQKQIISAWAE